MTYRKYFDNDDPDGPQQFYDVIAGQAASPTCKHCDKPAEWRWTDADGNESSNICQQCMDDVTFYQDKPLWQFDLLQSLSKSGDSGFIDIGRLPVLPLAVALLAGYAIHFMAIHGIFASLSILAR